ncbi:MAG: glycosyltransferase family 4 protein [Chloroflexi bacterium]|nr:glycosyltransferase family 4 protein [Chloroflexota bacterium]
MATTPTTTVPLTRVLHLISSNQRRGAECFAAELASGLSHGPFDQAICVLRSYAGEGLETNGVRCITMGNGQGRLGPATTLNEFRRLLWDFRPDLIMAHGSKSLKYAALSRFLSPGSKRIYRNIGTASFWAGNRLKVMVNKMLLRSFDAVVSLSPRMRDDFQRTYNFDPRRIEVIPNGVDGRSYAYEDREELRRQQRAALGLSPEDQVLISVGKLSHEKGPDRLPSLIRDLRQEGLAAHLLMVGDGPMLEELRNETRRLGIDPFVHFLGLRRDVPMILPAADVFVLPSRTEAMPSVVAEAGMAGLPVVAYGVGAIPEVVRHDVTGLVAPAEDQACFRQAVLELLQDEDRRRAMGVAGRAHSLQHYELRTIATQYERLFLRVVNGQG